MTPQHGEIRVCCSRCEGTGVVRGIIDASLRDRIYQYGVKLIRCRNCGARGVSGKVVEDETGNWDGIFELEPDGKVWKRVIHKPPKRNPRVRLCETPGEVYTLALQETRRLSPEEEQRPDRKILMAYLQEFYQRTEKLHVGTGRENEPPEPKLRSKPVRDLLTTTIPGHYWSIREIREFLEEICGHPVWPVFGHSRGGTWVKRGRQRLDDEASPWQHNAIRAMEDSACASA